jgi:hypothetical protein
VESSSFPPKCETFSCHESLDYVIASLSGERMFYSFLRKKGSLSSNGLMTLPRCRKEGKEAGRERGREEKKVSKLGTGGSRLQS